MVANRVDAILKLSKAMRLRAIRSALTRPDDAFAPRLGEEIVLLASQAMSHRSRKSRVHRWLRRAFGPSIGDLALQVVASRFESLPPEQRELALGLEDPDWPAAIAESAFAADTVSRRSVSLIAALSGRVELSGAVIDALEDPGATAVAEAAVLSVALAVVSASEPVEDTIEALGLRHQIPQLRQERWRTPEATDRARACTALAQACRRFDEHRRRAPLLASLLLLDRATVRDSANALAEWFLKVDHPSHAALRGALRWCRLPVARLRAWEWLWRTDLGTAASDRLARAESIAEHDAVLSRASLGLRPARAKRLSEIELPKHRARLGVEEEPGRRETVIPTRSVLPQLSAQARRGLPLFVSFLRGDARTKQLALEPLLTDQDPFVRHSLVRHAPPRCLADLALDADERVARSAFIEWSESGHLSDARSRRAGDERRRLIGILARSPHASVRAWAKAEAADAQSPTWASLAFRVSFGRRLRRDRDGTLAEISRELRDTQPERRHAAAMLARRLSIAPQLERELIELAAQGASPTLEPDSPDARAAATGASALADVPTEASDRVLRACLESRDGRIRANAVESLARHARIRPLAETPITPLLDDPHHRVRGNAIKAGIAGAPAGRAPTGVPESLFSMLADEREMHRAAGAWVAGRALRASGRENLGERYAQLLARVCEMARFDESPRVRQRALLAAAQAQTELRAAISLGDEAATAVAADPEVASWT